MLERAEGGALKSEIKTIHLNFLPTPMRGTSTSCFNLIVITQFARVSDEESSKLTIDGSNGYKYGSDLIVLYLLTCYLKA